MDTRKWIYLLLASTVAGFGLGEAEFGEVKAAVSLNISRYAEKNPVSPSAMITIETFGITQLCADAQIKLGITEEQCTIEMICKAGILLTCESDPETFERSWGARSFREMGATGNFTASEPQ